MNLIPKLCMIGGLALSQCGPPPQEPVPQKPDSILIEEGYKGPIDIDPPTRLDVLLEGDPDDDPEYFRDKCARMGGDTELIFDPTLYRYICENVDY